MLPSILTDPNLGFTVFKCDRSCYKHFNEELLKAYQKIPNDNIRRTLEPLISNDLIYLAIPNIHKNLVVSKVFANNNNIVYVFLNIYLHDVLYDGTSSNYNKILYSVYFAIVHHILHNFVFKKYKFATYENNKKLLDSTAKYFNFMLVKHLKLSDLYKTKRDLFDYLCYYFFYRFYALSSHEAAHDLSISHVEELNVKDIINTNDLKIYKSIDELFDLLPYYNVVSHTSNSLKHMLSQGLGVFSYFMVMSDPSSLIASIILSKYSHPNFKTVALTGDMSNSIESIFENTYLKHVSYDIKAGQIFRSNFEDSEEED